VITRPEQIERALDASERASLRQPETLDAWLAIFHRLLPGSEATRNDICDELRGHLRERMRDLMLEKKPEHEALRIAVAELGDAANLVQRFEHVRTSKRRRLLMNGGLIGLGLGAAAMGVVTFTNLSPGVPAAVYGERDAAQSEPPGWVSQGSIDVSGETTFATVVDWVRDAADGRVRVHWRDLEDRGYEPDTAVMLRLDDASIAETLDDLVDWSDDELAWRGADGGIELGIRDDFDIADRVLAVYDVEDILADLEKRYGIQHAEAAAEVTGLIGDFVESDSWQMNGGIVGHIEVVGGKMFINAPPRLQEKASWILEQLANGGADDVGGGLPIGQVVTGASGLPVTPGGGGGPIAPPDDGGAR